MTKTLTEQWREGELDGGYYYLIMEDETLRIDHTEYKFWNKTICWEHTDEHFVKEVLAPVPSHQEFVQQRDFVKDHLKVLIENMNLKRKLEIATKALKKYAETETYDWIDSQAFAKKALKEMEGVK